ncbi:hypothetical protein HK096_003764, partial [Nowakowskiella sp. JEL0078]
MTPDHYFEPGGVPVFKPTFDEFQDFKTFMQSIDEFGLTAGIVKIIPPAEWKDKYGLLDMEKLKKIRIKSSIKQEMSSFGLPAGCYRQVNLESRKIYTAQQWFDMASSPQHKVPMVTDEGRIYNKPLPPKKRIKLGVSGEKKEQKTEALKNENTLTNEITQEIRSSESAGSHEMKEDGTLKDLSLDLEEIKFDLRKTSDCYSDEFCGALERVYWRNLTYGAPYYGADLPGALFNDSLSNSWNLSCLDNLLSKINIDLPGVN